MSAPSTAISENVFQKPKRGRPTVWEISSDGDRLDMEFAREMKQIITRVIISSSASDPSKILSMKRGQFSACFPGKRSADRAQGRLTC